MQSFFESEKKSGSVVYFCIAHRPILYSLPENTIIIWTGERAAWSGRGDVRFLSDISDELYAWHPFLANSSANFAIADILRSQGLVVPEVNVCIFTYRKFFNFEPASDKVSKLLEKMYLVNEADVDGLCFNGFHEMALSKSYCLAQPINVKNMYGQYLMSQMNAADMLRYLAIAVDFGFIKDKESINFLNISTLIPGGAELGLMPAVLYCDIISVLKKISFEFLRSHSLSKCSPIARRSLASCNERMGSYLLLKKFSADQDWRSKYFGYLHNITLKNEREYVAGAAMV